MTHTSLPPKPHRQLFRSGFLSAWFQTPPGTNSEMFTHEPSRAALTAALWHIEYAKKHDIQTIELAGAHTRRTANVDPDKLADPVAAHCDMETTSDGEGTDMSDDFIKRLKDAADDKVIIGTLGTFENALHLDLGARRQNIMHFRRAIRAAARMKALGLGTEGVTVFVGRDVTKSVAENLRLFAKVLIPIALYAKRLGVKIFIENCPMCGWSETHEVFIQNIANNVEHWIVMARIIEEAGLKGWVFINYDASHDILQFTRPEWVFQILKRAGYAWIIGRFHGKDLSRMSGYTAAATSLGSRIRGPWEKMSGDQPLPGATHHNPLAIANGQQVDWFGFCVHAITSLGCASDPNNLMTFTTECEHGALRYWKNFLVPGTTDKWDQERHAEVAGAVLASSIQYIQHQGCAALQHIYMRDVLAQVPGSIWSHQPLDPNNLDLLPGIDDCIDRAETFQIGPVNMTENVVIE